jgi:membrane protease YdiL (CAAX protease family)
VTLPLAAQIPLALLLQWAFYGQRPRWLSSVEGGFRWRWFGRAALTVVPIWVVYVAVAYLIEPERIGRLSADASVLLIAALLTTPLQAAGEEHGARGLINRAAASWRPSPRLGLSSELCLQHPVHAGARS